MLTLVAYLLNTILVATGVFQYLKLELCWAGLGVGIGVVNLLTLYLQYRTGMLVTAAALGCVVAIAQGAILGTQAVQVFADKGLPAGETGMWDLIFSGHDFSYAFAYIGAGLATLAIIVQERGRPEAKK